MTDLKQYRQPRRVLVDTDVTAAEAVTLNLDQYDTFLFSLKTTGAPAFTWSGVKSGNYYNVEFLLVTATGDDALTPTNAASTNNAGTSLIFHSSGSAHSGAGTALWPTLSTTDGVVDYANWISPNGVDFFLVQFLAGLDE